MHPVVDTNVRSEDNVSVTTTFCASDGPLLVTFTVYVRVSPAVTVLGLWLFVTDRSALGAAVSVSVALLFPSDGSVVPPGAVTVAVFARELVAAGSVVATSV